MPLYEHIEWNCHCMKDFLNSFYGENDLSNSWTIYAFMILSVICTGLTFLFIFFLPGIQEHPMKIIMWYTGASFSFMWVNLVTPFVCQWNLDKLYQYTTPFNLSTTEVTLHLAEASRFAAIYCMSLTVAINMVLSIDLLCTLRQPF